MILMLELERSLLQPAAHLACIVDELALPWQHHRAHLMALY